MPSARRRDFTPARGAPRRRAAGGALPLPQPAAYRAPVPAAYAPRRWRGTYVSMSRRVPASPPRLTAAHDARARACARTRIHYRACRALIAVVVLKRLVTVRYARRRADAAGSHVLVFRRCSFRSFCRRRLSAAAVCRRHSPPCRLIFRRRRFACRLSPMKADGQKHSCRATAAVRVVQAPNAAASCRVRYGRRRSMHFCSACYQLQVTHAQHKRRSMSSSRHVIWHRQYRAARCVRAMPQAAAAATAARQPPAGKVSKCAFAAFVCVCRGHRHAHGSAVLQAADRAFALPPDDAVPAPAARTCAAPLIPACRQPPARRPSARQRTRCAQHAPTRCCACSAAGERVAALRGMTRRRAMRGAMGSAARRAAAVQRRKVALRAAAPMSCLLPL